MAVYMDLVILLNFLVDLLLLLGANRLSGYPPGILRCSVSSVIGGIYAGVCLLPGFAFLAGILWRIVCLSLMSIVAFGWNQSALRRGILFVFLSMALGGIALGLGRNGVISLLLAASGVAIMCLLGFQGRITDQRFVPVELVLGGRKYRLTALHDTGNTLTDPVTGQQVLVVGADVAGRVLGLTEEQLADPVGTVGSGKIPGLRLIPYRAVGQPCGMLLAIQFDEVNVNGAAAGKVVAFSSAQIGREGAYQALTGGVL